MTMCGILGYASQAPHSNPESLIEQRDLMRHRGPDDAGLWCAPDARVVLAHRRLAIIDLSAAGGQPFADATGNKVIVLSS